MRKVAHIAAAIVACGVAIPAGAQPQGDPPNILFILVDDLGWGDLRCFGNTKVLSPRIDQLADEGTRYTHFYVASPVCSPTRAALMSGRFPSELAIHTSITGDIELNESRGVVDWLDPSPTVTSLFHAAGYSVGLFGKWHIGSSPEAPEPGEYGIDDYVTIFSQGPQFEGMGDDFWWNNSTELMVDESIEFLDQNVGSPFFLILSTLLPHGTLNPSPEQLEPYADLAPGPGHWNEPNSWIGARQIYYASITAMDEQIGRLLDHLDTLGVAGDTLVVFTSDNGPSGMYARGSSHSGVGTGGPFRGKKWSLYEGGVRMPMIIRWPGQVAAGAVDNESVISIVDFLPTFCSIAGIPLDIPMQPSYSSSVNGLPDPSQAITPGGRGGAARRGSRTIELDGENVADMILGTPRPRTKSLLWEWRFTQRSLDHLHRSPLLAIRKGDWKLLLNPDFSRVELYNVVVDTWELHNHADDQPAIFAELAAEALEWQATLPPGPYVFDAGENTYPWPQP